MTSIATCCGGGRYYIEFKTDNPEAYKTVQEICRLYLDREKLMPKKPKSFDSVPHNRCPHCNEAVRVFKGDLKRPVCVWCGQALDWSDAE